MPGRVRVRAVKSRRSPRIALLLTLVCSMFAYPMQPSGAATGLAGARAVGQAGSAFLYPWGLSALPDGSVLVSDYWNYSVKRFSSTGQLLNEYAKSTKGTNAGQHLAPYDVAFDPARNAFYFGDVDANRTVDRYGLDGSYQMEFGGPSRYTYPSYPAVASDGRVFVADSRSHRISVVNANTGAEIFRFGTQGAGTTQFRTPRGIAFCHGCGAAGADLLFVADSGNARVQVWSVAQGGTTAASVSYLRTLGGPGSAETPAPGTFGPKGNLRGIAVDEANGWVYVVDATNGFTSKFAISGTYLTRFGGKGTGKGRFPSGGRGVTVDTQGRVWVADLGQFRVHIFSSSGQFLSQVPEPPQPPPLGGFNTVSDVAVDEQGNIWAVDTMNQRFQKFSPQGVPLAEWGRRGGGSDLSFNYPRGIAVDDTGPGCPTYTCVLVGDTDAGQIVKFDANGNTVWSAGGEGAYKAWAMAVAADGTIYAPDVGRARVVVLSSSGSLIRTLRNVGIGQRTVPDASRHRPRPVRRLALGRRRRPRRHPAPEHHGRLSRQDRARRRGADGRPDPGRPGERDPCVRLRHEDPPDPRLHEGRRLCDLHEGRGQGDRPHARADGDGPGGRPALGGRGDRQPRAGVPDHRLTRGGCPVGPTC